MYKGNVLYAGSRSADAAPALPQLRHHHGAQQNGTGNELLVVGGDAHDGQTVADQAQEKHGDHRAQEAAAAAVESGAPHNDGTDRVHLHVQPGVGLGGVEPGGDDDARQSGEKAHEGEGGHPVAPCGHAAALECLRIAAQGGDIVSPTHAVEQGDQKQDHHKGHGDTGFHAKDISAAEIPEILGQLGDGDALGDNKGQAAVHK